MNGVLPNVGIGRHVKNTNWNAIQSYKSLKVGDTNIRHMTMGSWKADKSNNGLIRQRHRGDPKKKKSPAKLKYLFPPVGGWQ